MSVDALAEQLRTHGAHIAQGIGDPDELAEAVERWTRPHAVRPRRAGTRLDAHLHVAEFAGIAFSRLTYGGDVSVVPAVQDADTFLFPITLRGEAHLRYGRDSILLVPGDTTVIPPYRQFRSQIPHDHRQVIVALDQGRLEQIAGRLTGGDSPLAVEPPVGVFQLPESVALLLESAVASAAAADSPLTDPRLRWRMEELIIESLLLSVPGWKQTIPLDSDGPSAKIRRAMRYMLDRIDEPLSMGRVAAHVGITPRALQSGFKRDLDETPARWFRAQRLERAHQLLRSGDPRYATVTAVAHACGFFHLGEFSAAFRKRYGVVPSQLLSASVPGMRRESEVTVTRFR